MPLTNKLTRMLYTLKQREATCCSKKAAYTSAITVAVGFFFSKLVSKYIENGYEMIYFAGDRFTGIYPGISSKLHNF